MTNEETMTTQPHTLETLRAAYIKVNVDSFGEEAGNEVAEDALKTARFATITEAGATHGEQEGSVQLFAGEGVLAWPRGRNAQGAKTWTLWHPTANIMSGDIVVVEGLGLIHVTEDCIEVAS